MNIQTSSQIRFGGVLLTPGVGRFNMSTYYICCIFGIMLTTFIPGMQPYLLTEFLHIPEGEQGEVTGMLGFAGEIAILIAVAIWGPLSDKVGRRYIMSVAFMIIALACFMFPRAESYTELIVARVVYSIGIAAYSCITVALIGDLADPDSRGKALGFHGMFNGVGALITVLVLLRLPSIMQARSIDAITAGFHTYHIVAVACAAVAILIWVGLKSSATQAHGGTASFSQTMKTGFSAARDPLILLAYGAAFVSRGNLAIVGSFLTLWLKQHGTLELGMTTADAFAKAGMMFGIVNFCALLGAPVFGIMTDRINHVTALTITLGIGVIGYGGTYFVTDPFGATMIACAVFIGLAEVGCIITSGVLINDRSPEEVRGAVVSFFSMCGAIGIMVASIVGGWLFDHWHATGPFVLFAGFAALVTVWGLVLRSKNVS